jgi:hypothetical protein
MCFGLNSDREIQLSSGHSNLNLGKLFAIAITVEVYQIHLLQYKVNLFML